MRYAVYGTRHSVSTFGIGIRHRHSASVFGSGSTNSVLPPA
ncbi:hypothetical protein [Paenibacillus agaridevorans]|nr:hypothetical protein [Paenibacillus agaridevorans]